jgi:uncharacterized repeat protein (TIGR03806 family)
MLNNNLWTDSSIAHRTRRSMKMVGALLLLQLLVACGGGSSGGGQDRPSTQGNTVYQSAVGGQLLTLDASDFGASGAASYAWRQIDGPTIVIEEPDSATIQFTAPEVTLSEKLSLELSVAKNDGTEVLPVEITVVNSSQIVPVADKDYKLTNRASNASCHAPPPPPATSAVVLQRVFPNISLSNPADMDQAPGDDSHWYIVNIYDLKILRFANDNDVTQVDVVLDLSQRGGRIRSMTFHPDFASNKKIYIQIDSGRYSQLLEYTWSDALTAFEPDSEKSILSIESAHSDTKDRDHTGGQLAFGPDGYLYLALGDGTRPRVFNEYSQNTDVLWGSLLRIDVNQGGTYSIPPDNPFANGGGRPEIFAWGFRHPWKWNFDSLTGEIWLGDVGLTTREEVNLVEAGGNYGWPLREGFIECPECELDSITIDVDLDQLIDPIIDFDHDTGQAVTGGYVYRGSEIPDLVGVYIFADYSSGKVFSLRPWEQQQRSPDLLTEKAIRLSSFGQDIHNELYALDFIDGGIYKLVLNSEPFQSNFPTLLSETGCVDMGDPDRVIPGVIPYSVQVPLWSDDAVKTRWLALPDGKAITTIADSDGDLDLPVGTVLVKHFRLFNQLIETRLFMRHDNGEWAGYTYEWNDGETEAFLLPGAKDKEVNGQLWHYPSRAECLRCHTRGAGGSLGLTTRQLNTHQSDGKDIYSQMRMLQNLDVFKDEPAYKKEYAALQNSDASVEDRARAYLEVNCAGCHQPDGDGGRSTMDLRMTTPLANMDICEVPPVVDSLGIPNASLLNPGNPANSILYLRMSQRGVFQMPPLGSNLVDPAASAIVFDWILSLDSCM